MSSAALYLTLTFIVLKVFGVIAWGWFWVLCPLWLPLALAVVILAFIAAAGTVAVVILSICSALQGGSAK